MELAFLPATEQARLIRGSELSSVELVELYLGRIGRAEPELNAFVTLRPEEALEDARAADASASDAPSVASPSPSRTSRPRRGSARRTPPGRSQTTFPTSTRRSYAGSGRP